MNEFEIFFADLRPDIQQDLLVFAGIQKPEEANWDIFPVTSVFKGEIDDGDDD